jgi:hypothetical protein
MFGSTVVEIYKQDGRRIFKKQFLAGKATIALNMPPANYVIIAKTGEISEIRKIQILK